MNIRSDVKVELYGILLAAFLAILVGFIIILFVSTEPIKAISSFLLEPFYSLFNFGTVLNKAIPLIFTGLALSMVFQAGIFSMGAEGQLYVGALAGAIVATYVSFIPYWLHIPLVLLSAMVGGALFALIPAILKAYIRVNEIVSTLMLNFIAILSVSFLINNLFRDPSSGGKARMPYIQQSAKLDRIIDALPTHSGLLFAILACTIVFVLLYKTRIGYELRIVGKNPYFAEYGGINNKTVILFSMLSSGALAGVAGIIEILGIHGTMRSNFSAGLGWDGIIIALLARNHPIGVVAASFFYAYIQVGAQLMQSNSDVSRELAVIIQVLLVLLVSAQAIFNFIKQYQKKKLFGGGFHVE